MGAKAVIDTRTPIMYLDIHVQAGGTFVQDVPEEYSGFAYVWRGSGSFTEDRISVQMGKVKFKKLKYLQRFFVKQVQTGKVKFKKLKYLQRFFVKQVQTGAPYERLTGMFVVLLGGRS